MRFGKRKSECMDCVMWTYVLRLTMLTKRWYGRGKLSPRWCQAALLRAGSFTPGLQACKQTGASCYPSDTQDGCIAYDTASKMSTHGKRDVDGDIEKHRDHILARSTTMELLERGIPIKSIQENRQVGSIQHVTIQSRLRRD